VNVTSASVAEQYITETSHQALKEKAAEQAWNSGQANAARQPLPLDQPALKPAKRKIVQRKRLTVSLSLELLERTRNAVYWTKGLTLARLLEQALAQCIEQREQLNGQPFPQRLEDLKGGRPRNSDQSFTAPQ
jgi:hypothetical protein